MNVLRRAIKACADSWQFAAVGVGAVAILTIVVRTAQRLADVARSDAEIELALARAVAEDHALDYALHVGAATDRSAGAFTSRLRIDDRDGRRGLRIRVLDERGASWVFACDILDGALPEALQRRLTLLGDADAELLAELPEWVVTRARPRRAELPVVAIDGLDPTRIDAAHRRAFRRDDDVALLRLKHGTDRTDHVLVPDEDGVVRPGFGADAVLRLDGNLWIEGELGFATIELEGPSLLVVEGNVYVDLPVIVRGGELVVIARRADGGAWTEGSGHVFLGLAGSRDETLRAVSVELTLVCEGDCVVGCEVARVAGALAVGGALEHRVPGAQLRLPGTRLPDGRSGLPGVALHGAARPGRLRLVEDP